MTRLAITGAAGRMGLALIRCAHAFEGLTVAAAIERSDHEAIGHDAGDAAGIGDLGVLISGDPERIGDADVLVDFTFHTAAATNVAMAARLRRAIVLGTTGLDEAETALVHKAAAEVPVVWSPNMSLGVNLLFALAHRSAGVLGMDYRVEIEETHHIHKKDAPSGTALRLGEKVAEGRGQVFKQVMLHAPGREPASPKPGQILIRSHREGEVVGDHTVSFITPQERIELTHHTWSRDALAMGALHAARWVETRRPGLYTMQDVLGLDIPAAAAKVSPVQCLDAAPGKR